MKSSHYEFDGVVISSKRFDQAMALARDYSKLSQRGETARLRQIWDQIYDLVGSWGDYDETKKRHAKLLPAPIKEAMGEDERAYRREVTYRRV